MTGFAEKLKSVTNGQEAMDYLQDLAKKQESEMPDIIFLDINMPVMNGWEFLEQFNKVEALFTKQPSVYVLSSTVDPEDYARAASYGVVKRFVSKPLTKDVLESID
ncbi:response regulator [Filimonas lacunae]|nr:response regulator [Filimonas lacunae]BAV08046.1 two-component response regulator [Filimonas lacunae]